MNERDQCCISNKQWVNFPIRLQKHIELAHRKKFPEWFLLQVQKQGLNLFEKDNAKHSFLRQIYICSLYFADENGDPNLQFAQEYRTKPSSKKNLARVYDVEFAIASYPKEVLQKIQSINGIYSSAGKPEILTKTMMYFQAARQATKSLQGSHLLNSFFFLLNLYYVEFPQLFCFVIDQIHQYLKEEKKSKKMGSTSVLIASAFLEIVESLKVRKFLPFAYPMLKVVSIGRF
jgi:hypothetical protein